MPTMSTYQSLVCQFDSANVELLTNSTIPSPMHTGLSTSDYEEVSLVIGKD